MKLMVFLCNEEIYESAREGYCPFLLEFVRNCKLVVFKDLGPDHSKRSRLRWNSWIDSIKNTWEIKHEVI